MSRFLLTTAVGLAVALPAHAHVSVAEGEAAIGGRTKITLSVPHGCDGAATTAIRVAVPDGFNGAQPMPKPGWDIEIGEDAITWSGGELPDAYYDEFVIRGTVSTEFMSGDVMYFPVDQTCAEGAISWSTISGSQGDGPAPSLTLVAGMGDEHVHSERGTDMAATTATAGDLEITAPFIRATLPNQPVAGGFMKIANTGDEADRLVGVNSDSAGRMEIHEMRMEGDIMRMRQLDQGLPIPAGETVSLEPGGYHVMFMDLSEPMEAGNDAEVTLSFEKAGDVTLTMPVLSLEAAEAMGGGMDHDHSHGDH